MPDLRESTDSAKRDSATGVVFSHNGQRYVPIEVCQATGAMGDETVEKCKSRE